MRRRRLRGRESLGKFRYCHWSRCRKSRGSAFAANIIRNLLTSSPVVVGADGQRSVIPRACGGAEYQVRLAMSRNYHTYSAVCPVRRTSFTIAIGV